MENDLINRQRAIDEVMEVIRAEWHSGISKKIRMLNAVYCALEDIPSAQPTIDAVPVIRCGDCLKKRICLLYRETNDNYGFCAWAKRKDNG